MTSAIRAVDQVNNGSLGEVRQEYVVGGINLRHHIDTTSNIAVIDKHEFEWNPKCTTSHKLDVYPKDKRADSKKGDTPSYFEFTVNLDETTPTMHLEIMNCAREDAGFGFLIVEVNGQKEIIRAYQEDDAAISPELVEKNDGKKEDHLALSQINISGSAKKGINTIRISLHPETESGVSIRWIEVVKQPTHLSVPPKFLPVPESVK